MTTRTGTLVDAPKVHKPAPTYFGHLVRPVGPIRGYCEDYKPWSPPKLSQNGKPFEPAWGKPGSTVWFDHFDGTDTKRLSGQVWSEGDKPGSLWVVIDQVPYLVS